jgi:hypothetical protein
MWMASQTSPRSHVGLFLCSNQTPAAAVCSGLVSPSQIQRSTDCTGRCLGPAPGGGIFDWFRSGRLVGELSVLIKRRHPEVQAEIDRIYREHLAKLGKREPDKDGSGAVAACGCAPSAGRRGSPLPLLAIACPSRVPWRA